MSTTFGALDTASREAKSADTTPPPPPPPTTLADEVLISARKHCRDVAAYDKAAAEYACSFCGILRPDVRAAHSCAHAICEPCAAECARIGKSCRVCAGPFWLWEVPDFWRAPVVVPPSSSSSSTSFASTPRNPPIYTHPSPVGSRAVQNLVFSCPNACDQSAAGLKFADLVGHCIGGACTKSWTDCGDCKQRVRSIEADAHARECRCRLVRCTACDRSNIRYYELDVHRTYSCPKTTVPCPNRHCGVQPRRENVAEHLADSCLYQVVPCVIARFGCGVSAERRHLESHIVVDAVQHLRLSVQAHVDLERRFAVLEAKVDAKAAAAAAATVSSATRDYAHSERNIGSSSSGGGGGSTAESMSSEVGTHNDVSALQTVGPDGVPQPSVDDAWRAMVSTPFDGDLVIKLASATCAGEKCCKRIDESGTRVPPDLTSASVATATPCASAPLCAIDLPMPEMKRRLESLMLKDPTDRPLVLAADRHGAWYVASVVADTKSESVSTSKAPRDTRRTAPVVARFDGFRDDTEEMDLASGRVRPLFETPRDHAAFLDGLRPGDAFDCRVRDTFVWCWAPCVILWRHATEMGVRKRECVRLSDVHVLTTTLRARCLPLGVASRLPPHSTDALSSHVA